MAEIRYGAVDQPNADGLISFPKAILDALPLSIMELRCGPADQSPVVPSLPRWCHGW